MMPMQYMFPGGPRGGGAGFRGGPGPGYLYELTIEDPLYLDLPRGHRGNYNIKELSSSVNPVLKWYNTQRWGSWQHGAVICGGRVTVGVTKYVPYTVSDEKPFVKGLVLMRENAIYAQQGKEVDALVGLGIIDEKDREYFSRNKKARSLLLSDTGPTQHEGKKIIELGRSHVVGFYLHADGHHIRSFRAEGREDEPLITAEDVELHFSNLALTASDIAKFKATRRASLEAFEERVRRFIEESNASR